jgi:HD-GYP domain-containing protein (c-di-GMP phosphodiesterase class II)
MPKALKLYIIGLVTTSAIALVVTSLVCAGRPDLVLGMQPQIAIAAPANDINVLAGLTFWTVLTLVASALPVRMPRGTMISVAMAPIVAAMVLGGPVAAGFVAAIGSTELRELRGRVPWYGSLSNHAGIVLPAVAGALVFETLLRFASGPPGILLATLVGATVLFSLNTVLATTAVSLQHGDSLRLVLMGDARAFAANNLALAPLAWLMAQIYALPGGWWATLLFGLPLYTTRLASHSFVEMREMFTQTIGALAEAVDKRDPFTSKHSRRVMEISIDIGRVMRLSEPEMEAIEWGGLLHDVGKIGVPDHVLLKADKLTRDERAIMNAHPVLGAQIIAPVTKLAPELPIIRHHHEWYNGSGYPDRLIGEEIPKLARLLHVADAFEAMTAQRPYRMKPLSIQQALEELRKFAGVQFDPLVVDAFVRTKWVEGIPDPGRAVDLRPVPLLGHAAGKMTRVAALPDAGVGPSDTR